MKYYLTLDKQIMAIDDNQDFIIQEDWKLLNDDEFESLTNPTKDDIGKLRVEQIKIQASQIINDKYPLYKQLNIMRNGGVELEEMSIFIDNIREQSNKLEADKSKTANDYNK